VGFAEEEIEVATRAKPVAVDQDEVFVRDVDCARHAYFC
jgi:hypothetical protein